MVNSARLVTADELERMPVRAHDIAPSAILTVSDTLDLHPSVQDWSLTLEALFARR